MKNQASVEEYESLLKEIEPQYYTKIIIHQYPELLSQYTLMGYHLKETIRQQMSPQTLAITVDEIKENKQLIGSSIHKKVVLENISSPLDYVFLSPVFSSISKPNYHPSEDWQVRPADYPFKLIALGGIEVHNLLQVKAKGFKEVAFLGAVWGDLTNIVDNYQLLCKKMKFIDLIA